MSVTGEYVLEILVNRLGGLSLPRKSVVRLTDRPDTTLDVYCGRKTTTQQQQPRLRELSQLVSYCFVETFDKSSCFEITYKNSVACILSSYYYTYSMSAFHNTFHNIILCIYDFFY